MARSPISPATSAFRNKRLSVIAEDGSANPPQGRNHRGKPRSPEQSPPYTPTLHTSHRPESRQWTDKPPHHSADQSPPGYQHWNDATPLPRRQRFMDKIRGNKQIARRGGWKRLLILIIILIILIIALAVGLGVGLSQHNNNNNNNSYSTSGTTSSPSSSSPNTTTTFPEGSYTINVYSTNVSTSCTPISDTWTCYPYTLYSTSTTQSQATYQWIITAGDDQTPPSTFNLSSAPNIFAPQFSNIPLTLNNKGTPDEYYSFSLPTLKRVFPSQPIVAGNNRQTQCWYNSTILHAQLYTSKPFGSAGSGQQSTNSGSNLGATPAAGETWTSWPYAVSVTETAVGGENVPNCYVETDGATNGERITAGLTAESESTACMCGYSNWDFS